MILNSGASRYPGAVDPSRREAGQPKHSLNPSANAPQPQCRVSFTNARR
jgi:hypothetical protein